MNIRCCYSHTFKTTKSIFIARSHRIMEPPAKRRCLSIEDDGRNTTGTPGRSTPRSLSHPVSPPRRRDIRPQATPAETDEFPMEPTSSKPTDTDTGNKTFKSPFQLTWIRDLPPEANTDAVTLGDILGDPLVAECWDFNYLHDIDFLLSHFDRDVRQLVRVHVVHGFWKKEDPSRLMLQVSLNQQQLGQTATPITATADTWYRSRRRVTKTLRFTAPSCRRCLEHITPRCWSSSAMTIRLRSLSTRRT